MKKNLLLCSVVVCLLSFELLGQSGTINWPSACGSAGCPSTYSDPNGFTLNVSTTYGTGSGSAVNVVSTDPIGTTVPATYGSFASTSSVTAGTAGLRLQHDYGTNFADAQTGNMYKMAFNKPLAGVSFNIYDISSYVTNAFNAFVGTGTYNDKVIITGIDANGNTVTPTLSNIGQGIFAASLGSTGAVNNSYTSTASTPNIVNDQYIISGNTAYVTGGHYNSNGGTAGTNGDISGNLIATASMDISVSFGVPVKEVRVVYANQTSDFFGTRYTTNTTGTFAANLVSNQDLDNQGVLLGNFSYTDVVEGAISGNVGLDTDNDDNKNNNTSGVTITLYNDTNGNGILDGTEGSTPALIDSDGNGSVDNSAVTTTDGNGNYNFPGVPPGNYIVVETDPANVSSVSDSQSADNDSNSNSNTNDNAIPVTLVGGETDPNNDFVDEPALSNITGTVWEDNTDNNQFDKDAGVSGVTITLYDASGTTVIASTTTNGSGGYAFNNVPAGDYIVRIGTTVKTRRYDNDDTNDGGLDTEENNGGGSTTTGFNTSDGDIPVTITVGITGETDTGNDFIVSDFANGNAPLPVNLKSFEAFEVISGIEIKWATASEQNNRGFSLRHSVDAKNFIELAFIDGNGNNSETSAYSFIHEGPVYGNNYYQLIQYDYNNTKGSLSNVIVHNYSNIENLIISYPNPSKDIIRLKGVLENDIISIYKMNGQMVNEIFVPDNFDSQVSLSNQNAGTFIINIERNGLIISSKRIIKE